MIEFAAKEKLKEYEEFLKKHPKGHFMQSPQWGELKSDWRWHGIISRGEDGNIRGVLSLLSRKMPGFPWSLVYGGRGPVCDLDDRETLAELLDGAQRVAKSVNAYDIKLDPDVLSSSTDFIRLLEGFGYKTAPQNLNFEGIQPRYVFRLPMLGRNMDELMASFASKTRYNIRLAQKNGVEVYVAGPEALPDFSRIMRETGDRDGFIVRGTKYFERMLSLLGEHARLYMVRYQGQHVAGAIAINYGDKVWYLYGASSNEHRNVMPNYLMQYEMIRWAVETGARIYDFRGVSGDLSPDNPLYGLYRFKKGFNGDFCEFVGEMDLVLKPFAKLLIDKSGKVYKNLRRLLMSHK